MSKPRPPAASAPVAAAASPFDGFLCFTVYSTAHAFNRAYKAVLDELGVTYTQALAIFALSQRGDQTMGELGERLFLETNTLTPLIKRLEAAGLVTRRRDPDDERVVRVSLTEQGERIAEQAACVPEKVLQAAGVAPEALADVREALVALRGKLHAAMSEA